MPSRQAAQWQAETGCQLGGRDCDICQLKHRSWSETHTPAPACTHALHGQGAAYGAEVLLYTLTRMHVCVSGPQLVDGLILAQSAKALPPGAHAKRGSSCCSPSLAWPGPLPGLACDTVASRQRSGMPAIPPQKKRHEKAESSGEQQLPLTPHHPTCVVCSPSSFIQTFPFSSHTLLGRAGVVRGSLLLRRQPHRSRGQQPVCLPAVLRPPLS